MKNFYLGILSLLCIFYSCSEQQELSLDMFGYIDPSGSMYNEGFETCSDSVYLTNNMRYRRGHLGGYYGGTKAIFEVIDQQYDSKEYSDSGYLTVRFVLNCRGETGRFSIHEANLEFESYTFNKKLKHDILALTASLDDWETFCFKDENQDSYFFITYKIVNGKIVEILP